MTKFDQHELEQLRAASRELALAKGATLRLPNGPTRVVILGGGFAGVHTAKYLTSMLGHRKDVEVELLSEENYFVFQPLLPEVAAGGIAATHVVNPIRELVPGVRFRCCEIRSVDLQRKCVVVSQGEGLELVGVQYDHLVFCLGKVTSFERMPGVAEHALAMKDLSDAFRLRNHVVRCLELADIELIPERKRALLTFVVAGGGFSGVETIGELHELVERSLKYFPRIDKKEVRFQLIHSQTRLLPEMPEGLGMAARKILEKRGVEMVLGTQVRAASRENVYLTDDRVIPTRTFICTVGNAPNPIVKRTILEGGFTEAKLNGREIGVFETDGMLQCLGKPGYWAVGDCAGVPSPTGKGFCPPTAQFAVREAKACARNILATIDRKPMVTFAFKALGVLASLGQRSAVAQVLGIELTGFVAWFMWRTIYLFKLPGFVRRLRVALDWTLDLFFPRDITQMDGFRPRRLNVHHYEPGEAIVRKGQLGREFYIILKGSVEVLAGSTLVARLGTGEVFGERALLEDKPRAATVCALGEVDLLVMSRSDFRAMVTSFPVLNAYFMNLLRERHPDAMGPHGLA
ncbi:FAD-dependent oxidoreductase [Pendulispora rubella]|uniref:NADH:ubiquinone reductase (non-electrogenic) n=1 Tax=Pendulispora rubella TaxID=2741070 RepID=A0ABZ2LMV1_9BACT